MRPAALLRFYRARLRSRLGAELLAFAGIAVGVALVFAAQTANTSLTGAVRELGEGIVGGADFQLAARSAAGFDQRLFRRADRIPGAAAAPVAEARVNLVGPAGRRSVLLVGGDPRFAAVGGPLLRAAARRGGRARAGLLLPAPLAAALGVEAGDRLAVETGRGVRRQPLAGVLGREQAGGLAESPLALAALPAVQRLAGMRERVSRVFVAAAPGREAAVEARLRRLAAGRLNLGPADAEAGIFERAAYPTSRSTSLFSALSALVGFLFALSAMLLTVPQRRRLVADLRMSGYAPATVLQVLLFDALVLGVAGAGAGLLAGEEVARRLFDSAPGYLDSAFAVGTQRIVTWQGVALAVGAGLLAACVAVLAPLRQALAADRPGKAGRQPARRHAALAGAGCLALGLVVSALAPDLSLLATGFALLSLLLLLPAWLALAARALGPALRGLRDPAAILAALQLRAGSARVRTVALTATGAVAVFATVAIGGAQADLQRGLDRVSENVDRGADVWVAFRGPSNIFATTAFSLPPGRLRALERLEGVRSVSRNRGSFLDVAGNRAWVLAPALPRVRSVLAGLVEEGDSVRAAALLGRGGWVALSRGLARELGVGVGDRVRLPLPLPTRLRVATLTSNFGWPGGAVVLGAPTYARAWGSAAVSSLGVRLQPSARMERVLPAIRSIAGGNRALRVETTAERARRQREAARAGLARLSQISKLVLISSALAMAASMAAMVWQRRPTLAALKLHGLRESELWRSLLAEGFAAIAAGCLLGACFGLLGQVLLARALEAITGFPVIYELAALHAAAVLALLTTAAVAMLALPGWLAVRVRPQAGLAAAGD